MDNKHCQYSIVNKYSSFEGLFRHSVFYAVYDRAVE